MHAHCLACTGLTYPVPFPSKVACTPKPCDRVQLASFVGFTSFPGEVMSIIILSFKHLILLFCTALGFIGHTLPE